MDGPYHTKFVVTLVWLVAAACVWYLRRRKNNRKNRDVVMQAGIHDAVDMYSVLLLSGLSVPQALQQLHHYTEEPVSQLLAESSQLLGSGIRMRDVVSELRNSLGPHAFALCETLQASERDGLPIALTLERLSAISRQQRRQQRESEARQLPIRMALPLVGCVLPSFVLLAVVPMFISSLNSFGAHM